MWNSAKWHVHVHEPVNPNFTLILIYANNYRTWLARLLNRHPRDRVDLHRLSVPQMYRWYHNLKCIMYLFLHTETNPEIWLVLSSVQISYLCKCSPQCTCIYLEEEKVKSHHIYLITESLMLWCLLFNFSWFECGIHLTVVFKIQCISRKQFLVFMWCSLIPKLKGTLSFIPCFSFIRKRTPQEVDISQHFSLTRFLVL